jgi:hypothetical protein
MLWAKQRQVCSVGLGEGVGWCSSSRGQQVECGVSCRLVYSVHACLRTVDSIQYRTAFNTGQHSIQKFTAAVLKGSLKEGGGFA